MRLYYQVLKQTLFHSIFLCHAYVRNVLGRIYTPAEDGKFVAVNFENVEDKTLAKIQKTLAETNGK